MNLKSAWAIYYVELQQCHGNPPNTSQYIILCRWPIVHWCALTYGSPAVHLDVDFATGFAETRSEHACPCSPIRLGVYNAT